MALITATETFDEEQLDEEMIEKLEPFLTYVNDNFQNIVAALSGGLGDRNSSSRIVSAQCVSGLLGSFNIDGPISSVQFVRVESQRDSLVLCTGFNWWPKAGGFDFAATFSDNSQRNIIMKVDFNV